MISEAQTFRDHIKAGDESALKRAIEAGESIYIIGDEKCLSTQGQFLAAVRSLQSETYSFRVEFNDQSYLLVKRVAGETESTECGALDK